MPKRKTLPEVPDYTGDVKNPENLLIQKSNPLQSLSQTSMTLTELKILDAYLARIDSHKPEKRYVRFEKGELENLLGVKRILKDDLFKRVNNLFQTITVQDEAKRNGFTKIALFEKAECEQDEYGLWQINLMCTNSAMEYIFNIENLGYLRYRLKNVINLTSRYSYILYLLLEDNNYHRKWRIGLDELKKILNCTSERYDEFKFFNSEILKKCHKEINEKTTLSFEYTLIKKVRKVVAIEFESERKPTKIGTTSDSDKSQKTSSGLYDDDEIMYPKYSDPDINFLGEACGNEFTESQVIEIRELISDMSLPYHPYGKDFEQYHYLSDVYEKFKKYTDGKGMDNKRRFSYFKRMIENDEQNYE